MKFVHKVGSPGHILKIPVLFGGTLKGTYWPLRGLYRPLGGSYEPFGSSDGPLGGLGTIQWLIWVTQRFLKAF